MSFFKDLKKEFKKYWPRRWFQAMVLVIVLFIISIVVAIVFWIVPFSSFGDEIKISPTKILLAKNNGNFSPTFYVKNNTDEIMNQIWLKLVLTSDDISLRNEDIAVKLISDDTRMSLDVPVPNSELKINISDYMFYIGAIDSLDKQAFFIFRNQLAPKETLQMQISNNYPKKLQGEHFFKASFVNSSDEPVEVFTYEEGPLEIITSAIGEKIAIFRGDVIMHAQ